MANLFTEFFSSWELSLYFITQGYSWFMCRLTFVPLFFFTKETSFTVTHTLLFSLPTPSLCELIHTKPINKMGDFLIFFVLYSTLLNLPPLRFCCVGGCWDRTQECCDFGIGSQTLYHSETSSTLGQISSTFGQISFTLGQISFTLGQISSTFG